MSAALELGPVLHIDGAEVRVGTCSWTDRTLVKDTDWYPKRSMSAAERLAYYSARFSVVEADSTYYGPPSRQLSEGWAERTPGRLPHERQGLLADDGPPHQARDAVAGHRRGLDPEAATKRNVYPHHLPAEAVDEVWARFADALQPLQVSGRLGSILLQYPPWFTPKRDNRDELARPPSDWVTCPRAWSCGRRCGSGRTTSTARWAGFRTTT